MFPFNATSKLYTSGHTPTPGSMGVGNAPSALSPLANFYSPTPLVLPPPPILPPYSKPHLQSPLLRQVRPLKRLKKTTPNYRALYIQAGKRIYPPRSPSTVLNDILGYQAVFEFTSVSTNRIDCQTVVGGKCYSVSHKESKKEAKEALADEIIPCLVKEKYEAQCAKGPQIDKYGQLVDFEKREDETPWASVCSLALYKLYEEWTKNGFKVPEKLYSLKVDKKDTNHTIVPGGVGRIISNEQDELIEHSTNLFPKVSPELLAVWKREEAKTGKAMPENPTSRNPVQLLNEIRSNIKFNTVPTGSQPNIYYVSGIEIDGCVYTGKARNKKESKKLCAMHILKSIYMIEYPDSPV